MNLGRSLVYITTLANAIVLERIVAALRMNFLSVSFDRIYRLAGGLFNATTHCYTLLIYCNCKLGRGHWLHITI